MDSKTFTLDELCALADIPRRTVRYYIQFGLVPRPVGAGRAAHYTAGHLDRLLQVKKLADAGLSLERIRESLGGEAVSIPPRRRRPGDVAVRSHLYIAPGVELQISPEDAGLAPEQLRELVRSIMEAVQPFLSTEE
ncbi:MAG: helix-turn-helix domain-containing protein [Zoogloeaceae bacterium]|jgi:DNA-binding transcriptional MerR regulator|nr:helix-turn-helix domain-containing protein [Zoogloeaceae bacterium]